MSSLHRNPFWLQFSAGVVLAAFLVLFMISEMGQDSHHHDCVEHPDFCQLVKQSLVEDSTVRSFHVVPAAFCPLETPVDLFSAPVRSFNSPAFQNGFRSNPSLHSLFQVYLI